MKKKIISIFVSMLLFVTVLSVTGAVNIEKDNNLSLMPKPASTGPLWEDDFENYTLYQFLDGTPDDGGWEGWGNDPTVGAYVTDNQSRSSPYSVDISGDVDLVHKYSQVGSGNWTYTAWQYVPDDYVGDSSFILLNTYTNGGGDTHWSTQIKFLSSTGMVLSDFDGNELPLITGRWVEIRVEIDFGADEQTIYYDGVDLVTKSWTEGVSGPGGAKNLGAVDLYSGLSQSTPVYYDDMSLQGEVGDDPVLFCEGDLHFGNVSAGATLEDSFIVKNVGGGLLDWKITKSPSWGEWEFDPESGDDLPPEDPVTVQVTVFAPDTKDDWESTITITNMENPDNTCLIDVSMTTPMSQPFLFLQFLERLIQRFPVLELIFSHLLG